MKTVIYDCEIIKGIPKKDEQPLPDIEYCEGWRDFDNMGISVICAHESDVGYRVFLKDNFHEFVELLNRADVVVGFNSLAFDNRLIEANGMPVVDDKTYDILVETWKAEGLTAFFQYPSHVGYSLDAIAAANLGMKKSGNGALAPVDWQRGNYGAVIDYCLRDVILTKRIFDQIIKTGSIVSPKNPEQYIAYSKPWFYDTQKAATA